MNTQDAIDVIESVSGFTDKSTPVGEAWAEVLSYVYHPTPPAPEVGEVKELVAALKADAECVEVEHYDLCNMTADQMRRAATLLQQLSAPAPAVVPVAVGERLPGEGDLDAEGTCWVWNVSAYTWGLFRLDLTAHSHWLPAHAIPFPQAEEVEA